MTASLNVGLAPNDRDGVQLPVAAGAGDLARPAGSAIERDGRRPFVVGIGGTPRPGSSSERALRIAMMAAEAGGAETLILTARELEFPMYAPDRGQPSEVAASFLHEVERADGLIVASPGYHGSLSGLVKNALDYLEELRENTRPYLEGRAIGCIACASGWQAATTTLVALRSIVHALRGWPTPLGVAINSSLPIPDGVEGFSAQVATQLEIVGSEVTQFAHLRIARAR